MTRPARSRLAGVLALLAVLLAACGSGAPASSDQPVTQQVLDQRPADPERHYADVLYTGGELAEDFVLLGSGNHFPANELSDTDPVLPLTEEETAAIVELTLVLATQAPPAEDCPGGRVVWLYADAADDALGADAVQELALCHDRLDEMVPLVGQGSLAHRGLGLVTHFAPDAWQPS